MELQALVESLLFVADQPVTARQLANVLEVEEAAVEEALSALGEAYVEGERGLRLQRKGDRVQLVTVPEAAPHIQRLLGLELSGPLSQAALETLSIVAYRQPVTRAQVEAIRGVNSDGVLRTLVGRGLIESVGRLEQVGRPILYGTTFEFLQQFGLRSVGELPALEDETSVS
jgi:segregation and condensation protein B